MRFSPLLVPALRALAKRRGIHGRIEVDAVKLSHHGSRANVTNELLAAVEAKHLIFSTNNEYFNHPNEEAVARVVVNGEHPTLWFNYDTPKNRKWSSPALLAKYGYSARFPTDESSGVTLELPLRVLMDATPESCLAERPEMADKESSIKHEAVARSHLVRQHRPAQARADWGTFANR